MQGMTLCLVVCAALFHFYPANAGLLAPIHSGLKTPRCIALPSVNLRLKGGQGTETPGANDEILPDYNQNNPAEIPTDLKEDASPGNSAHNLKAFGDKRTIHCTTPFDPLIASTATSSTYRHAHA